VKVAFAGGGTGGHVYPGLAIAEALASDAGCAPLEVLFIGTRDRLEARIVPAAGVPIAFVRAAPLVRGSRLALPASLGRALVTNLAGFVQSLAILHRARPDVLIATGGYVALPVVAALRFVRLLGRSRARIALLETNAVPGVANRLLAPLADEIWYAVAPGRPLRARERVVGTPVRSSLLRPRERAEARRALGLVTAKTTVVVLGGSLGAASLNAAVAELLESGVPAGWQIAVVAGERDAASLRVRLAGRPDAVVIAYLDDPRDAYAAADIVVARAGASTLGELAATATPALLVPYPFATADHQRLNAVAYAASGAARVVADAEISGPRLRAELTAMLAAPAFGDLRAAARNLAGADPRTAIVGRVKALCASNSTIP
jgi:UDP-N-acetylglucosamine--N-acetylmuramyl-(pentapeptide) pyrophosphoryl-undecaprenol N-acetylglucosamine transferase